jgi:transaldolase
MVKIPATMEGLPAIEQSIADGININITLIFSRERYAAVMDAYLRGLIRRVEANGKIDRVHSVASFFVSRVDSLVDKLLDERIAEKPAGRERLEAVKGKAAIANAKLAYQDFRKKFATEAYAGLRGHGANLQRPLWASTSTKNPAYPDVYYVEELIGPDTVDTMPPATIDAYRDHGKPEVRLDKDVDQAERAMADLAAAGIDMEAVTRKLEDDGVAAFAKSFDSLISTVEERRQAAIGGANPGGGSAKTDGAAKPETAAAKDAADAANPRSSSQR